jgi:hypothetical protein
MTDDLALRFKYICGRYWRVLVPALLVVSALAFATAAAGVTPPGQPQQTTVETDSMAVETTLSTAATVTGNTTLYERGDTLTDMPVYLRSATPEVRLIAETTTPTDRTVSVTQQVVLRLSATRNGEVFWSDARTLAVDSEAVTNGTLRTETTLDIEQLARGELADVTAETGGVGAVRAEVVAVAVYETDAYSGRTTAATPLRTTDRAYELQTPQRDRQTNATTVQQAVGGGAGGAGFLRTWGGALAGDVGVSLGGLLAVGIAGVVWLTSKRIGDFDAFRRHYERVRYVEWISRGSVPETGKLARVPVETLVDLVDIAIDSEKRVIHDTDKEVYAVVDGNLMYEYRDGDDRNMNEFGFAPAATLVEAFESGGAASDGDAEVTADGGTPEAADSWFGGDAASSDRGADAPPETDA